MGDPSLEDWFSGVSVGDRQLDATIVDPDAVGTSATDERIDCLVVDGGTLGPVSVDVVERCRGAFPDLPVVVLVDGRTRLSVEALSAGATETLSRSVATADPRLCAEYLVSTIERTRARGGIGDLYDAVAGPVTLHDPETGELLESNERFREILGYSRGNIRSVGIDEVTADVPGYGRERAKNAVARAAIETGPVELGWPFEAADGTIRWMDSRLERVTFGTRDIVVWSATRHDPDRRAVLFENTPDPVMTVRVENGHLRVTEVNAAFEDVFGVDAESVADRPLEATVADERDWFQAVRERTARDESIEAEGRWKTPDGECEFLFRVVPFEEDGRPYAYVRFSPGKPTPELSSRG